MMVFRYQLSTKIGYFADTLSTFGTSEPPESNIESDNRERNRRVQAARRGFLVRETSWERLKVTLCVIFKGGAVTHRS